MAEPKRHMGVFNGILTGQCSEIMLTIEPIDFAKQLMERSYTEVDTMGAQGCSGGVCEIVF